MSKVVVYRRYYDGMEANIVLSKLQSNGIECFLTNENTTNLLWHLSIAHGGINLMMDEEDFNKADLILSETPIEIEEMDKEGPRCPKCNSNNIEFGTQSKSRINWIQIIFGLLLAGPAPLITKAYHCFNCNNNFHLKK